MLGYTSKSLEAIFAEVRTWIADPGANPPLRPLSQISAPYVHVAIVIWLWQDTTALNESWSSPSLQRKLRNNSQNSNEYNVEVISLDLVLTAQRECYIYSHGVMSLYIIVTISEVFSYFFYYISFLFTNRALPLTQIAMFCGWIKLFSVQCSVLSKCFCGANGFALSLYISRSHAL
jgi:hypothetical protein